MGSVLAKAFIDIVCAELCVYMGDLVGRRMD